MSFRVFVVKKTTLLKIRVHPCPSVVKKGSHHEILIIGGSGHVSGAVCRECLQRGHDVTVLSRGRRPVDSRAKAISADRNDAAAMRAAFADPALRFDSVIDCICYAPEEMAVMLELFRSRCQQLVFISTDFVFDPAQRRFPQPVDAPILADDDNGNQSYGYKKSLANSYSIAKPLTPT